MAHFAKLNANNEVTEIHVVSNDIATTEQAGIDFLHATHGPNDTWKQTSYNTQGGVHRLDGTPFRKNYAAIGFIYDADEDAFIRKNPYPSWTLNKTTWDYEPPTPAPDDGDRYEWDEETNSWVKP
jgi:hypothetical protein